MAVRHAAKLRLTNTMDLTPITTELQNICFDIIFMLIVIVMILGRLNKKMTKVTAVKNAGHKILFGDIINQQRLPIIAKNIRTFLKMSMKLHWQLWVKSISNFPKIFALCSQRGEVRNRHIASIAAVKSWIRFGQCNKTPSNTMIHRIRFGQYNKTEIQ